MDCASPDPLETSNKEPLRPAFTGEQEQRLLLAASRRVAAAVRSELGESTRCLLGDIADTPVYGAFVTLKHAGKLRSCCGHIHTTVSLSEALDHAADRAATQDPRFPPIPASELSRLSIDVWVLWSPEIVAERGEDRLRSVVIGRHGVQIACGPARGLLLPGVAVEHGFDAKTFLEQVCLKAGLPTDAWKDEKTTLCVFQGDVVHGLLETALHEEVRRPAVAGGFYPGDPAELQRMVEALFAANPPVPQPWSGALVPHAGWVYSGRLAAAVLQRIAITDRVIVFCPKHRPHGARWAVAPHGRWLFPGGALDSDPDLAGKMAAGIPGLELDAEAHRQEHAIEVQLPFLARLTPRTKVVGVVVGDTALPELLSFGTALSVVLRDMRARPLLIISSDMNHFANDAETRKLDRLALDAIATLDPECVYETVRRNRISMCGLAPCIVVMEALRWLGALNRCESVGYATSADAGGPDDRVVGYAGLLFA